MLIVQTPTPLLGPAVIQAAIDCLREVRIRFLPEQGTIDPASETPGLAAAPSAAVDVEKFGEHRATGSLVRELPLEPARVCLLVVRIEALETQGERRVDVVRVAPQVGQSVQRNSPMITGLEIEDQLVRREAAWNRR